LSGNGELNVPLLIADNAPLRIIAARKERDELVAKVRDLNHEIAVLETHLQVGSDGQPLKRESETNAGTR
jgi:hypothetical protein